MEKKVLIDPQNEVKTLLNSSKAKSNMHKENKHLGFITQSKQNKSSTNQILSDYELYILNDKLELSEGSDDEDIRLQKALKLPFDVHQEHGHHSHHKHNYQKHLLHPKKAKSIKEKLKRGMSEVQNKLNKIIKKNQKEMKNAQTDGKFVFSPDSQGKLIWDVICMLLIFYELITIPIQISFNMTISDTFGHIVDSVFLFDILVTFNTAIYIKGVADYDRVKIASHYLRLWFWLDLSASFPYQDVIEYILDNDSSLSSSKGITAAKSTRLLRIIRFVRFIKIVRLLRLAKLKVIFDKIEEFLQLSPNIASVLSFLQLSIFVLFWSHWLGCIFHFVATFEPESQNWLKFNSLDSLPWQAKYVNSLYWAVTTMTTVGYGDLSPTTPVERLIGIFFLLVATGVFSFTMNTIGAALQQIDQKKTEYRRRMTNINNYMKKVQLPSQLQNRVRRYLAYIWDSDHSASLNIITANLSQSLKYQFTVQVNGTILANCTVICQLFTRNLLIEITQLFKELTILPDEYVFKESGIGESKHLYFIQEGNVDIVLQKTRQIVARLEKHEYFGEISFFTNEARSASARSVQFSDLFYIDRDEFLELLNKYPEDKQKFCHVRDNVIFKNDYSQLSVACYGCMKDDHLVANCPVVHFVVDQYIFIRVLHRSQRKLMSQFARRDLVQYNARTHITLYQEAQNKIKDSAYKNLYEKEECNLYENINDGDKAFISQQKEALPSAGLIRSKFRQERMEKRIMRRHLKNQQDKIDQLERIQKENMSIFSQLSELLKGNDRALGYLQQTKKVFLEQEKNKLAQQIDFDHLEVIVDEENQSEEDDEIEYIVQAKFDRILKTYNEEKKLFQQDINKDNINQKKAQSFMLISDFDRAANFVHYNIQNNADGVLQEYDMVYHQKMECRARQDTDYEETVFDDLILFYKIEVESLSKNRDFEKHRLKQNLKYRDRMVTELGRQTKKQQNLFKLPGVKKVKKGMNLIKAVNKLQRFNNGLL